MTLILALEGRDGLVLGADSRGTIGDPRGLTAINDVQKKLFRLSDYCGITVSGSAELAARMIDLLQRRIGEQGLVDADPIMDQVVNVAKQEYNNWFGGPRPWFSPGQPVHDQRPVTIFILAGYNRPTDQQPDFQPRIYLLNSQLDFAPQLCTTGIMLAGVPQYAIYLSHRYYNREMTVANLTGLAAYLIAETATQDPKVGGPIRLATVKPNDPYRELGEDEVSKIVARNEKQNLRLRKFFFGGEKA
jgi:hypothetical protein